MKNHEHDTCLLSASYRWAATMRYVRKPEPVRNPDEERQRQRDAIRFAARQIVLRKVER